MLNIAEGYGKRSPVDRARILDIARGSALESAACLDVLVARKRLERADVRPGKDLLVRVVSVLTKLIEKLLERPSTSTSTTQTAKYSIPQVGDQRLGAHLVPALARATSTCT